MASRTAYVGTQASGDVLTSANFTRLPGGWIGYSIATAGQSGISSITDLTSLSVTVTVNADRLIRVTGFVPVTQSTNNSFTELTIRESSTTLAASIIFINLGTTATHTAQALLVDPTTGSHTYKLSLSATGASIATTVSATQPAFILVEDIGPST